MGPALGQMFHVTRVTVWRSRVRPCALKPHHSASRHHPTRGSSEGFLDGLADAGCTTLHQLHRVRGLVDSQWSHL